MSAIFFQSSLLAILRPSYTTYPHRGIFFPCLLQALPRLVYKTATPFVLAASSSRSLRLRLERSQPQTLPNSRAGIRHIILPILTVGNLVAIYYVFSPRQLFPKYVFFGHSLGSVTDRDNLFYSHVFLRHSHGKCYNGHSPKFYLLHGQMSANLFNQSSRLAILRPSLLPDPTASSSDTPTAKVRTAAALMST